MQSLSNLSSSKDGHYFNTSWVHDPRNTKPSVNTYTSTVTYQKGSRVEPGVYSALFVNRETQVYQPAVFFNNLKMPKLRDGSRKRKLELQ